MTNFQKNSWITGFAFSLKQHHQNPWNSPHFNFKKEKKKKKANTSCPCRADANIVRGISQFINAAFGVSWAPSGSPVSRIFSLHFRATKPTPHKFFSHQILICIYLDVSWLNAFFMLVFPDLKSYPKVVFGIDLPISTNVVGMICQHILFVL